MRKKIVLLRSLKIPCSDIIELQNYLFPNKVSANDQTVLNCCNFVNCAKCDVCSFAEFSLVFAWRASIKGCTVIQNPVRKFRYFNSISKTFFQKKIWKFSAKT